MHPSPKTCRFPPGHIRRIATPRNRVDGRGVPRMSSDPRPPAGARHHRRRQPALHEPRRRGAPRDGRLHAAVLPAAPTARRRHDQRVARRRPRPLRLERRSRPRAPRRLGHVPGAPRRGPPDHATVKLQVTGPVTLAIALERGRGRRGCLARARAGRVAGGQRRRPGAPPGGPRPRRAARRRRAGARARRREPAETGLWDPLRGSGAPAWGMHVCGRVPWPLIGTVELDVVSFDVPTHGVPARRDRSSRRSCTAAAGSPGA